MVGLTTELPSDVPKTLPDRGSGPHEWNFSGNLLPCGLYHNKRRTRFPDLPRLGTLTPGQSVGLLVTPSGQLHLFLNGEHRCEIATGLPVDTPLWGVADVFGKCTKIKSEIMSGESSGAVISPSQYVGRLSDSC